MRWKIVFTTNGARVLFFDGEPIAGSDDLGTLLSFFGEITGQARLAVAS